MENLFFGKGAYIAQVIITVPIIYVLVVIYVRIFGIRTTASMNSFDWIVTVAMGSLVASTIVLNNVPIISGAIAILALIFFQYLITKMMFYSNAWKKWVHYNPAAILLSA